MSAIASFHLVDRDLIADAITPTAEVARNFGREIEPDDFPYSGYLMMHILFFLEDRGIPITASTLNVRDDESDDSIVTVLTAEHRPLLPDLDPDRFSLADMREALEEPDLTDDEIVETVTDLLNVLRGGIANLADNEAFVILIG